jgi:hypothetical protein
MDSARREIVVRIASDAGHGAEGPWLVERDRTGSDREGRYRYCDCQCHRNPSRAAVCQL